MSGSGPSAEKRRRLSSSKRSQDVAGAGAGENEPLRKSSRTNHSLLHYLDGYYIERHTVDPVITSGGFCDVFTGDHDKYGKVAMKRPRITIDGGTESQLRTFRVEAEIWKCLHHPNILPFVGMLLSDSRIWLVSLFADNGSLPSYLRVKPKADRSKLVFQLAEALAYLHSQYVVHGDIKGGNILVSADGDVLLSDFGSAKLVNAGMVTDSSLKNAGTRLWMAPELLKDNNSSKSFATDVYAFGITIYEILSGERPFNHYQNEYLVGFAILNGERPPRVPSSGEPYVQLWEVAEECWDEDVSKRPEMNVICDRFGLSKPTAEDAAAPESVHSQDTDLRPTNKSVTGPREWEPNSGTRLRTDGEQDVSHLLQMLGDAAFEDEGYPQKDGLCPQGTREELLERLDKWADDTSSARVLLLEGQAGRGKSTIARTSASRFRAWWRGDTSCAIFHFRRGNDSLNTRVVCALARQLAQNGNQLIRNAILQAVQDNKDVAHSRLEDQFKTLLVRPLTKLQDNPPRILFIMDALDECKDHRFMSTLLDLIHAHSSSLPTTVKFLLTSRPEAHVINRLHASDNNWIQENLDNIDSVLVAGDVRAYLAHGGAILKENEMKEWNRLIRELPRAELAPYNADRRVGTLTSCHEGTREPLLKDVANWVVDPKADRVYWLKERAGFGKTAVAHSVAEQAAKEGTLAASFFFSYQIADLNHASHVITTIVYQLSLIGGAPYKQSLAEAIENHPDALRAQLKDQVQPLFLDPLKSFNLASPNRPIVIVIDALDECQPDGAQHLINTLIATVLSLSLPLKLFITSRPEAHLTAAFSDLGVKHRVIVDTSNKDVETYLRAELAKIPSKPGIRELRLPREWITEEDIQALLERAGAKSVTSNSSSGEKGLFVYVATVIRFIGDMRGCDPQKHLEIVLSATPQLSSYRPFQILDDLYMRVLDVALKGADGLLERFHAVIGGIIAVRRGGALSVISLEMLLNLPRGEVRKTVVNLRSVVQYPDTNTNTDSKLPSFHHRSFTDFLTDKDRSGPRYYIDLKPHQKRFALGCLRVMAASPLKVEVTNTMNKEDYFFYPEIDSISPELEHAIYYLSDYSESIKGDRDLLEELEKFIRADFGWCCEVYPHHYFDNFYRISDAADPQDELDLPILYRALTSSDILYLVDMKYHVHALVRKELRRYISAITQRQDGTQYQMETQAMTTSLKRHVYELQKGIDAAGHGIVGKVCVAILTFARDAEATVDKYQLSIGNQEEVERSRKRTTFLRHQVKPLFEERTSWMEALTADELEAFEQQGVWTPKLTPTSDTLRS